MPFAEPRIKRWTRNEYYRRADAGLFEGRRVELIRGEIIERPPQRDEHYFRILVAQEVFRKALGPGFIIRAQAPLAMDLSTDPEPDVAVVRGTLESQRKHPKSAGLIIEVAESSLMYDRPFKGSLYAAAGIRDYWIINLIDKQLEVRRKPAPNRKARFGHEYTDIQVFKSGQTLSSLIAPKVQVAVAELFV